MTLRQQKLLALIALLLKRKRCMSISREPCRTSTFSGNVFVRDVLRWNPIQCLELLRMEKHVFFILCAVFREKRLLQDSRYVCVEEKIAIFLMTLGQNHRNRILQDRFKHSGETIHRHFLDILVAMIPFSMEIIKPPSYHQILKEVLHNSRFYPYCKVILFHTCFSRNKRYIKTINYVLKKLWLF
eukprot:TRINITY_DN20267_c0_g1_i1.p1 TRINITY_DN20267_c0_g1~~TRINITY_DN20267_c0_g1_i1.p1  ORF type:complete len:185 (-),score=6.40 TRINITY_DN20267_c0_g1_i1:245-799(-)